MWKSPSLYVVGRLLCPKVYAFHEVLLACLRSVPCTAACVSLLLVAINTIHIWACCCAGQRWEGIHLRLCWLNAHVGIPECPSLSIRCCGAALRVENWCSRPQIRIGMRLLQLRCREVTLHHMSWQSERAGLLHSTECIRYRQCTRELEVIIETVTSLTGSSFAAPTCSRALCRSILTRYRGARRWYLLVFA